MRHSAGKDAVPMFPVSGAEQFTTSDAKSPPRPRSSAMTPYYLWKLEMSCEGDASMQWHMYLEVREGDPELWVMCLAEEEVPKSELLRLLLEVSDDGDDGLPARLRVRRDLSMRDTRRGVHLVLCSQHSYLTDNIKVDGRTSRKLISFVSVSFAKGEILSSICKSHHQPSSAHV